jgi:hypothetical protein
MLQRLVIQTEKRSCLFKIFFSLTLSHSRGEAQHVGFRESDSFNKQTKENNKKTKQKMNDIVESDLDNIIEQLLSARGSRPGRQVNLSENDVKWLCVKSKEVFTNQPVLLELEAPIKICGKEREMACCDLLMNYRRHSRTIL